MKYPNKDTWKGTEDRFQEVKVRNKEIYEKSIKKLNELLEVDAPVDGVDLGPGWGGTQLHIVLIQE